MKTSIPLYKLQIVDAENHQVAVFHAGGQIERQLVLEISRATANRIGWWRSKAAVRAAAAEAVMAVVDGMKVEVTQGLERA